MAATFDPQRLIEAPARRGVRYVLIGAVAARLQGFPRVTADSDIAPATDAQNLGAWLWRCATSMPCG